LDLINGLPQFSILLVSKLIWNIALLNKFKELKDNEILGWLNSILIHNDLCGLALAGAIALLFIFFIGILAGKIYYGTPGSEAKGISSILLGFIVTSALASFLVFGLTTIFVPISIVVFVGIWTTRDIPQITSFKILRNEYIDFSILLGGFFLFFIFRIFSLLDPETGLWKLMFKDDAWYVELISSNSYLGIEGGPIENFKYLIGYGSFYRPYHYISFAIASLFNKYFHIRSFDIFHFFVCPLFQTLCLFSFYKTSKYITNKTSFSLLIALLVISTLRYSIWDEYLNSFLEIPILKTSWITKNFLGFQFLNSGFGFKFCMAVLLFTALLENLKKGSHILLSVFSLLNPIFLVLNGWLSVFYFVFDRKNLVRYFLCILFSMGLFYMFMKTQETSQNLFDISTTIERAKIILSKGIVTYVFVQYGYFIEYFYNILFFPALLCITFRKDLIERFFLSIFILTPLYSSWFSNKYFTLLFFLFAFSSTAYILFKHRSNYRLILILMTGIAFSAFSQLAHIVTDLNQIFVFLVYSAFYVMTLEVLSRYGSRFFLKVFIIIFVIINFSLNLGENQVRSIKISMNKNYLKLFSNKVAIYNVNRSAYYDSDSYYPFMTQFFIGEESILTSDSIFSTSLRLPKLENPLAKDQKQFRENLPLSIFLNKEHRHDTLTGTIDFIKEKKIGMIAVANKDKIKLRQVISIFSDSLENIDNKYMIYFRKP